MKVLLILWLSLNVSCAMIMKQEQEHFSVETKPAGAVVKMGEQTCHTPCNLEVSRQEDYDMTIDKPGYKSIQMEVDGDSWDPWIYGNIIFLYALPVALFIDFYTGYAYDLSPSRVDKTLEKAEIGTP